MPWLVALCCLLRAAAARATLVATSHEAIAAYLEICNQVAASDGSTWALEPSQQQVMGSVIQSLEGFAASLEPEAARADALNDLGVLFSLGHGVAPEASKAADYFSKAIAASNHSIVGIVNLGVLLHEGRGVPQDDERAAALFSQACASDHPDAYYMLATLFRAGRGVKQSFDMAFHLFTMAAHHGNTRATYMLGLM